MATGMIEVLEELGASAAVAWYTSAAGVANSLSETPILPVGTPIWAEPGARRRAPRIHGHGAQPT